jgi:microcin C transport system substrate-binding protein
MCVAAPASAQDSGWRESLTLYGQAKYMPWAAHFDYVNPHAPKCGMLKLAYLSAFDSLNPYILKGVPAPGMNLVFQSLMEPSFDEPQTYYPLIAKAVRLAPDKQSIEFKIDPRAKFDDGTPILASDVLQHVEA